MGLGLGRLIGARFRTRMKYQSIDQRMLFEMEIIIKWAKQLRKKNKLDDFSLVLLVETIVMETSYLLDKLHLKKVRKFFKKFSSFLVNIDRSTCIIEHLPPPNEFRSRDDLLVRKNLYRLFNFYIPCTRILEIGDATHKKFKETDLFRKLYHLVCSQEIMRSIIEMCEANETLSSEFAIPLSEDELSQIIKDVIEAVDKTEPYKRLENRVMQEIVSNTNIDEIIIHEEEFVREEKVSSTKAKVNRSANLVSGPAPL